MFSKEIRSKGRFEKRTIRVDERHIINRHPQQSLLYSPFGLAYGNHAQRLFSVGTQWPQVALDWMRDYDAGRPVGPISFEVRVWIPA